MVKLERHNQILLLSIALTAMSWGSLNLVNLLNHLGNHDIISNLVTIIGAIAAIGGFISAIVAIILFLIEQKRKTNSALH